MIAEDITSRFLNVVQLLNGQIPLIAIQMRALAVTDGVVLTFTKVIDELRRGLVDEDESAAGPTDRQEWESRKIPDFLQITDEVFVMVHGFAPDVSPNYLKHYVGARLDGRSNNFLWLEPRKKAAILNVKLPQEAATEEKLSQAGAAFQGYKPWNAYVLRISLDDIRRHKALLYEVLKSAYEYWHS